jgi:hypothetical protein
VPYWLIMLHRGPGAPLEVLVGEPSGAGYDWLRSWVSSQSNIRFSVRRPGLLTVDEGFWAVRPTTSALPVNSAASCSDDQGQTLSG